MFLLPPWLNWSNSLRRECIDRRWRIDIGGLYILISAIVFVGPRNPLAKSPRSQRGSWDLFCEDVLYLSKDFWKCTITLDKVRGSKTRLPSILDSELWPSHVAVRTIYTWFFWKMHRYQSIKTLGDGTYGSVVLARNQENGETVAIKK